MNLKKISFFLLIVSLLWCLISSYAYATTPNELASELYELGKDYGMTEAERVKVERFVNEYNVTDEQSNAIMAKAREAKDILDKTEISKLTSDNLNQLKDIAIQTAEIVDAKLVFTSNRTVDIYKNGVKIDTAVLSERAKLAYTGDTTKYMYLILPILLILAEVAINKKYEE